MFSLMIKLKNNTIRNQVNKLVNKRNTTIKHMAIIKIAYIQDYMELDKLPIKLQSVLKFKYTGNHIPFRNMYAIHKESESIQEYIKNYGKNSELETHEALVREEEDNIDLLLNENKYNFITIANNYHIKYLNELGINAISAYNLYRNRNDDSDIKIIELCQRIIRDVASDCVDNEYELCEDNQELLIDTHNNLIEVIKEIDEQIDNITKKHKIKITYLDYDEKYETNVYKITDALDPDDTFIMNYDKYKIKTD